MTYQTQKTKREMKGQGKHLVTQTCLQISSRQQVVFFCMKAHSSLWNTPWAKPTSNKTCHVVCGILYSPALQLLTSLSKGPVKWNTLSIVWVEYRSWGTGWYIRNSECNLETPGFETWPYSMNLWCVIKKVGLCSSANID